MKYVDLTGQKFGRLTVLRPTHTRQPSGKSVIKWECKCECGKISYVDTWSLKSGKTQSCGCWNKELTSALFSLNLVGQKFGKLTVIRRVSEPGEGKVRWKCLCECGNVKNVITDSLRSGSTVSCGCYSRKRLGQESIKHGKRHERIYGIYCDMKKRCSNPNCANYKHYGAKGIKVCEEWENDFMAFYNWAMGNGYEDNLTIDRIDSKGNYEPSNCQWITRSENTRKRNYEYFSKRKGNRNV